MNDWIPHTDYQCELIALVEMMALDHPGEATDVYILSKKETIREEPYIEFESLPAEVDEMYAGKPPVKIINKVKEIALLMNTYVWEMDFWEAPDANPGIDLTAKHFPPSWDRNKIEEAALTLATDPSIREVAISEPESALCNAYTKWWIHGVYEGVRMRFVINPLTQEIGYCCPLDDNGQFTSSLTVQELYGYGVQPEK